MTVLTVPSDQKRKIEDAELGALTRRIGNLYAKLQKGNLSPEHVSESIQRIADGAAIAEDLFSKIYIDGVVEPTVLDGIEVFSKHENTFRFIKGACMLGETYELLCNTRCVAAPRGYVLVREVGQSGGLRIMNLFDQVHNFDNFRFRGMDLETKKALWSLRLTMAFSPAQIKEIIVEGYKNGRYESMRYKNMFVLGRIQNILVVFVFQYRGRGEWVVTLEDSGAHVEKGEQIISFVADPIFPS